MQQNGNLLHFYLIDNVQIQYSRRPLYVHPDLSVQPFRCLQIKQETLTTQSMSLTCHVKATTTVELPLNSNTAVN